MVTATDKSNVDPNACTWLALNECLRRRTSRSAWPSDPGLEAWRATSGPTMEVDFVGSHALQGHVRALRAARGKRRRAGEGLLSQSRGRCRQRPEATVSVGKVGIQCDAVSRRRRGDRAKGTVVVPPLELYWSPTVNPFIVRVKSEGGPVPFNATPASRA